ncbi:MAG TPA: helix-turn-helix domain-containing protein [Pseudonocardiaceae bacterium]
MESRIHRRPTRHQRPIAGARLFGNCGSSRVNWGNDTMSARTTSTTPATLPALLSVTKAAEILGISRASAYRYAASGELPTRRLGGRVYVVTARLMDIVEGEAA